MGLLFISELTGSLKGGPGAIVTVKAQDVPKNFRESMQYYHNVVCRLTLCFCSYRLAVLYKKLTVTI